jgi:perosamine synthetase
MIHTSLSPNTEADDIFLDLKLILSPWKWKDKKAVQKVESTLGKVVKNQYITAVDSGRTSLYTILKAFEIGSGDDVLLQAYTCVAVPDPVLWAGARPVYVDCDADLTMSVEDLKKKITPKTKAIIVQHTFGMPARIQEIIVFARSRGVAVIEDCAHALGATLFGEPLGSFGDAAFFSFGRDKCVSSVFGGAISAASPELHERIRAIVAGYPEPGAAWVLQQLLHPIILAKSKFLYNVLGIGKLVLEASKRLHLISVAVEQKERSGGRPSFTLHKYSGALAVLALNQLKKIDRFNAHRTECAGQYAERLKDLPGIDAPALAEGHSYLRYTIFTPDPQAVFAKARKHGIQLGDWYTAVIAPDGVDYEKIGYIKGSCPNAERYSETTLNLPTHISITPKMIEYISNHVFN